MTVIEVVKGEKTYRLIMENDSPLGECFDVLCDMRGQVLDIINTHAQKEKESQPDINPVSDESATAL